MVEVKNFEHLRDKMNLAKTNWDERLEMERSIKSALGNFELNLAAETVASFGDCGLDISSLGRQGWELVSCIPQLETIPDAEYLAGLDYSGTSSSPKKVYKPFTNVRTERIILIQSHPTGMA